MFTSEELLLYDQLIKFNKLLIASFSNELILTAIGEYHFVVFFKENFPFILLYNFIYLFSEFFVYKHTSI